MGLNHAEKFKKKGVTKRSAFEAPPEFFTIAERGHYLFDPTSPLTPPGWMIQSVDEFGVMEEIECITDGDTTYVSKGRTRVRACLAANKRRAERGDEPRSVPYKLRDKRYTTDDRMAEETDAENMHRRDAGPLDIAERIAKYSDKGAPRDRIAFLAKCKPAEVPLYARINKLAPEVRDAIRDGKVAWRRAILLDALPRDAQVATLATLTATPEQRKANGQKMEPRAKSRPSGTIRAVAEHQAVKGNAMARALLLWAAGDKTALINYSPSLAAELEIALKRPAK